MLTNLELEAKAAWISRPYEPLSANIIFDSSLTNKSIRQAIDNISSSRGAITKGQIIVSRGEMVNEEIYKKIFSLNEEYRYLLIY